MKQNLKPAKQKPVVKEVKLLPSLRPLQDGLDQLFEVMQLVECQSDALTGAAHLHEDLSHHPYFSTVIQNQLQIAYENINEYLTEIHSIKNQ